jgi:uncharacterized protein (TIGR03000 family)
MCNLMPQQGGYAFMPYQEREREIDINIRQHAYHPQTNLHVIVPAEARLWVEGQETKITGTDRMLVANVEKPGGYDWNLKVQVSREGKTLEVKRVVGVTTDAHYRVNFNPVIEEEWSKMAKAGVTETRELNTQTIGR